MEDSQRKGTVTSLDSLFPAEEAQKAAKRVEDAIAEKKDELNLLQGFVTDNNKIVNLVRKLPEQLSHDIMVTETLFFFFCVVFQLPFVKKFQIWEMGFSGSVWESSVLPGSFDSHQRVPGACFFAFNC